MALSLTNHFTGKTASGGNSIEEYYSEERKQFLEFIAQFNEEYRLSIINKHLTKLSKELESIAPKIFNSAQNGDLFTQKKFFGMGMDNEIEMASFIEFLKILKSRYEEIEMIKAGEVKWIGEYSKFIEFYQILFQYNFVECDFLRFKQFFSLRDNLKFNLKMYDTSILFYELNEKRFISESTINSMLENGKIFAFNGKYKNKGATSINSKIYNDNKSKYRRNDALNKINLDVDLIIAMSIFGIKFES